MATAARSSAGPETMLLDTSPVASVERLYATLDGRASIALTVSVDLTLVKSLKKRKEE